MYVFFVVCLFVCLACVHFVWDYAYLGGYLCVCFCACILCMYVCMFLCFLGRGSWLCLFCLCVPLCLLMGVCLFVLICECLYVFLCVNVSNVFAFVWFFLFMCLWMKVSLYVLAFCVYFWLRVYTYVSWHFFGFFLFMCVWRVSDVTVRLLFSVKPWNDQSRCIFDFLPSLIHKLFIVCKKLCSIAMVYLTRAIIFSNIIDLPSKSVPVYVHNSCRIKRLVYCPPTSIKFTTNTVGNIMREVHRV